MTYVHESARKPVVYESSGGRGVGEWDSAMMERERERDPSNTEGAICGWIIGLVSLEMGPLCFDPHDIPDLDNSVGSTVFGSKKVGARSNTDQVGALRDPLFSIVVSSYTWVRKPFRRTLSNQGKQKREKALFFFSACFIFFFSCRLCGQACVQPGDKQARPMAHNVALPSASWLARFVLGGVCGGGKLGIPSFGHRPVGR